MSENYLNLFLVELHSKDILYTRVQAGNIKITFGSGSETVDISITERFFDKEKLGVSKYEGKIESSFGVSCYDIDFSVRCRHWNNTEIFEYEDDEAGENKDFSLNKDCVNFYGAISPSSSFDSSTLVYQDALTFCEILISIHRLMFKDEVNGRS